MTKEELEKENANLKVLRNYELNVANLEIEKLEKVNTVAAVCTVESSGPEAAHRLGCPAACGIFPHQRSNLCPCIRFLTTEP